MMARDVVIIGSTIRNGRIYFSSSDVKFFPPDSYADREGGGHKGVPVTFQVGGRTIDTDIRISSGKRLSPRNSFAFFIRQINAKEGDIFRVARLSDRAYRVDYLIKG